MSGRATAGQLLEQQSVDAEMLNQPHNGWLCIVDVRNTSSWWGLLFREQYFTHKVLVNLGGFADLVGFVFLNKGQLKGCGRLRSLLQGF